VKQRTGVGGKSDLNIESHVLLWEIV